MSGQIKMQCTTVYFDMTKAVRLGTPTSCPDRSAKTCTWSTEKEKITLDRCCYYIYVTD